MDNDNLVRQALRVPVRRSLFPWPPDPPTTLPPWAKNIPPGMLISLIPRFGFGTTSDPIVSAVPNVPNVPIAPDPPSPTPQPPSTTIKTPTTTSDSNVNTILIGIGVVVLFIIIAALVYFFLICEEKSKGKPARRTRTRKTGKSKSKSKTGTSKSSVSHASSPVSKTNSPMAKSPLDIDALPDKEKSSASKVEGSSKINKTVKIDPEGAEAETAVAAAESQDPNSGIQSVAFGNYKTKIAPSYRIEKAKRT